MCSIVEDDFGDDGGAHAMQEDKLLIETAELPEEICKKCNQEKIAVRLNFKEAQCKNCFLLYVRHKFRATLGASKMVPKNSTILVHFDGTRNNIVLLDMINYALSQSTFKRLHFNVRLLYIDVSFMANVRNRVDNHARIKHLLNQFSFDDVYYTSLGQPEMLNAFSAVEISNALTDDENKFNNSFANITTLSSKQDYLALAKNNLLYKHCNTLGCNFIFTSEISSDLAKTFLTNISLGRGSSVALDIGFVDTRDADIKKIRPIRDLNVNEINNYIKLNELECRDDTVETAVYGQRQGEFASIQNLTGAFVDNLQKNFASTVSTVYRTGDKIAAYNQNEAKCKFCRATIDCNGSNTLFAIEFSRAVSNNPNLISNDGRISEHDMNRIGAAHANNEDISGLKSNLCHGCRNIICDFNGTEDDLML